VLFFVVGGDESGLLGLRYTRGRVSLSSGPP
jgi:hypothetical protein